MSKKIYLIGLIYNNNLGDPIIFQSCKFMVEEIVGNDDDYEIVMVDLFGREPMGYNPVIEKMRSQKDYYSYKDPNEIKNLEVSTISDSICKSISKENSCIIFVGGGIVKYIYEKFEVYIDRVTAFADENDIPVMFNAVGIEGYNKDEPACIQLQNALNRKCVKMITVRDDLKTLTEQYEYKGIAKRVADSACYISKFVNCPVTSREKIGINCARPELFKEYGANCTRDYIADLMANTVTMLTKEGYKCELFDNGTARDDTFIDEILQKVGKNDNVTRKTRPATGYELVQTISEYKAIIATRLHASIVAFSCGVPFVSLVWNNKQKFFCKSINKEDWYVNSSDFNPELIIQRLKGVIEEGYDNVSIDEHCKDTIQCLREFIEEAFK